MSPEPPASTSLLSYLTTPNPTPPLVHIVSFPLHHPHTKHFWWDVRQVRPWTKRHGAPLLSALFALGATLHTPRAVQGHREDPEALQGGKKPTYKQREVRPWRRELSTAKERSTVEPGKPYTRCRRISCGLWISRRPNCASAPTYRRREPARPGRPSIVMLQTHYSLVAGWDYNPQTDTGCDGQYRQPWP